MKQSDIITAGMIAIVGVVVSILLCNMLLGDPNEYSVSFSTVSEVSNSLDEPNTEVFNAQAINPTVEVYVGQCEDWDKNGIIDNAEWSACHNNETE